MKFVFITSGMMDGEAVVVSWGCPVRLFLTQQSNPLSRHPQQCLESISHPSGKAWCSQKTISSARNTWKGVKEVGRKEAVKQRKLGGIPSLSSVMLRSWKGIKEYLVFVHPWSHSTGKDEEEQ